MAAITQDRLKELLHYDPETGVFTWLANRRCRYGRKGQVAGCTTPDGYIVIGVDGAHYPAHRLAWFYVHGRWPEGWIDHRSGERSDNRIENLREASVSLNLENQRRAHKGNKSGFLGVFPNRARWAAQIQVSGQVKCLGTYDTPEQAHEVYLTAKRTLHAGNTL